MDFSCNCKLTVKFINLRLHINSFQVYRMCRTQATITYYGTFPPRNRLNFHQNSLVIVILVARLLLPSVTQKLCECEHGVLTQKCMFILQRYLASKSFVALPAAFSSTYLDKEVPNKITILTSLVRFLAFLQIHRI